MLILALGTRGDLELFLLLARTLQDRGHDVQMVTSGFHTRRVVDGGIECFPVGSSSIENLNTLLAGLVSEADLRTRTRKYVERFLRRELAAARQTLEHLTATSDYFVSNLKITVSRNGTVLPTAFVTYDPPASIDELDRYTVALPRERILELVAFPRSLLDPQHRWPARFVFTGFWLAPQQEQRLPDAVEHFVSAGSPPLVLTTGSMRMFDGPRLASVFIEAVTQLGLRGMLINASGGNPSPSILYTGDLPYAAMFSRAGAVIHHGGVGTTAEVLRAGRPSIVLPQILAQKHIADLLTAAGACAGDFDPATVSADTLAKSIREAVDNARFAQAAAQFQAAIAKENGVDSGATAIERHWRTITTV